VSGRHSRRCPRGARSASDKPKTDALFETDVPAFRGSRGLTGRPRAVLERLVRAASETVELAPPAPLAHPEAELASRYRIEPLVREWLLELQVRGRSQRTIAWYAHKTEWYQRF